MTATVTVAIPFLRFTFAIFLHHRGDTATAEIVWFHKITTYFDRNIK